MEADEDHRLAGAERAADDLRRLHEDPLVDVPRPERRRARHLEVVAGVVAEGRPDEALQRSGVVGGGANRGPTRVRVRRAACATRRRLRRACAARSGAARYHAAPASSARRINGPSGSRPATHASAPSSRARTSCTNVPRRRVGRAVVIGARDRGSGVAGLHDQGPPLEVGRLCGRSPATSA